MIDHNNSMAEPLQVTGTVGVKIVNTIKLTIQFYEQFATETATSQETIHAPYAPEVDCISKCKDIERELSPITIIHEGKKLSLSKAHKLRLQRRQSIEPIISHINSDNRMDIYHLKGVQGDAIDKVLCATGFSIRWLMRSIAIGKYQVAFFLRHYCDHIARLFLAYRLEYQMKCA